MADVFYSKRLQMTLIIDPKTLTESALDGLVEERILQEGTDYGDNEISYQAKCKRLRRLVDQQGVLITFDEETQSCNLIDASQYNSS